MFYGLGLCSTAQNAKWVQHLNCVYCVKAPSTIVTGEPLDRRGGANPHATSAFKRKKCQVSPPVFYLDNIMVWPSPSFCCVSFWVERRTVGYYRILKSLISVKDLHLRTWILSATKLLLSNTLFSVYSTIEYWTLVWLPAVPNTPVRVVYVGLQLNRNSLSQRQHLQDIYVLTNCNPLLLNI